MTDQELKLQALDVGYYMCKVDAKGILAKLSQLPDMDIRTINRISDELDIAYKEREAMQFQLTNL